MNFPFDLAHFDKIVSQFREYFFLQILSWAMLMQLAVVGCVFLVAYRITLAMYSWCQRQQDAGAGSSYRWASPMRRIWRKPGT